MSYDLRNYRDKSELERKRAEFFQTLKLQQRLNKQYEDALMGKAESLQMGIRPVAPQRRTVAELAADQTLQRQIADRNLRSIMDVDEAQQVLRRLTDAQIYDMNSNFKGIEKKLEGRTNLTSTFVYQFVLRYLSQQRKLPSGLDYNNVEESDRLTRALERIASGQMGINPATNKPFTVAEAVRQLSDEFGVSTASAMATLADIKAADTGGAADPLDEAAKKKKLEERTAALRQAQIDALAELERKRMEEQQKAEARERVQLAFARLINAMRRRQEASLEYMEQVSIEREQEAEADRAATESWRGMAQGAAQKDLLDALRELKKLEKQKLISTQVEKYVEEIVRDFMRDTDQLGSMGQTARDEVAAEAEGRMRNVLKFPDEPLDSADVPNPANYQGAAHTDDDIMKKTDVAVASLNLLDRIEREKKITREVYESFRAYYQKELDLLEEERRRRQGAGGTAPTPTDPTSPEGAAAPAPAPAPAPASEPGGAAAGASKDSTALDDPHLPPEVVARLFLQAQTRGNEIIANKEAPPTDSFEEIKRKITEDIQPIREDERFFTVYGGIVMYENLKRMLEVRSGMEGMPKDLIDAWIDTSDKIINASKEVLMTLPAPGTGGSEQDTEAGAEETTSETTRDPEPAEDPDYLEAKEFYKDIWQKAGPKALTGKTLKEFLGKYDSSGDGALQGYFQRSFGTDPITFQKIDAKKERFKRDGNGVIETVKDRIPMRSANEAMLVYWLSKNDPAFLGRGGGGGGGQDAGASADTGAAQETGAAREMTTRSKDDFSKAMTVLQSTFPEVYNSTAPLPEGKFANYVSKFSSMSEFQQTPVVAALQTYMANIRNDYQGGVIETPRAKNMSELYQKLRDSGAIDAPDTASVSSSATGNPRKLVETYLKQMKKIDEERKGRAGVFTGRNPKLNEDESERYFEKLGKAIVEADKFDPEFAELLRDHRTNVETNGYPKMIPELPPSTTGSGTPSIRGEGRRGVPFVSYGHATLLKPRGRRIVGRGISRNDKTYERFGRYVLYLPALKKGILHLKFPSFTSIPSLPKREISSDLKDMIEDLLESGKLNRRLYDRLAPADRQYFNRIVAKSQVDDALELTKEVSNQERDEIKRFELVRGIVMAGNNSPEVLQELRDFLLKFSQEGRLNPSRVNEIMVELMAVA